MVVIGILVFNNHFRNRKVVWLTSPNMNNVILLGAIGFYVSVILFSIDSATVGTAEIVTLCTARTWLVQISFTLMFGSLFSKIYRVYKVFSSAARCKTSRISDKQLFAVLQIILYINLLLLIIWTVTDPVMRQTTRSVTYVSATDINMEFTPVREVCTSGSRTPWLVAFLVIDAFILLSGAYLSYQSRNVAIEILKNAKDVGLAIYTATLICCLLVPVVNSVSEPSSGSFVLTLGVVLGTNSVLFVIFKPAIMAIYRKEEEQVTKLDMDSLRSSQGTGASTELQTTEMPQSTVPSVETDTTTTTSTDTTT